MINPLVLEQAILTSQKSSLISELDVMTHYANLNMATSCFKQAEGHLSKFSNELSEIDEHTHVYARDSMNVVEQDEYYSITAGVIIFKSSFSKGNFKYIRQSLGSHNDNNKIDFYFSDKEGELLLPFELQSWVKKNSLPKTVTVEDAYQQNPLHPCFFHQIIPSPVVGVAVHSKLNSMIGFVAHPKLLISALNANLNEDMKYSLQYDTKIALNLLNLRYGLSVNKKVLEALDKLDNELISKIGEVSYLDIEGNW